MDVGHGTCAHKNEPAFITKCKSPWKLLRVLLAVTFGDSSQNDILEPWMTALNLAPTKLTAPVALDPVETMVRLALDLGFPALFDFKLLHRSFIEGKRAMELSEQRRIIKFTLSIPASKKTAAARERQQHRQTSTEVAALLTLARISKDLLTTSYIFEAWLTKRARVLQRGQRRLKSWFRSWFFIFPSFRNETNATLMYLYDEKLVTTLRRYVNSATPFITAPIKDMGNYTAPHITSARWIDLLSRYTNGTYNADTKIRFQKQLLQALGELLGAPDWGPRGLRSVMSWLFLDFFLPYTSGQQLVFFSSNRPRPLICYDHVSELMEFAITSRILRSRVSSNALRQSADMFSKVRAALRLTLGGSTWLTGAARNVALQKLDKMRAHIGGPGQTLDEAFANQHYVGFPDVARTGRFISEWFKFRQARARQKWADQTNAFFNISETSAYYAYDGNIVIVPAGSVQPVFFYADGSLALNYGSLGDALAHRIMNAFDVTGIQYDDSGQLNQWITGAAQASYVNRTNCLRQSHTNAGGSSPPGSNLDDRVDSENMGDLVGAATAYQVAVAQVGSTRVAQARQELPGLNLTAQQLYFVGRCMTLCKRNNSSPTGRFASARARCNVPAMNMDAFSTAFRCPAGARMNPASKCSFWR
ncbi:neprilysin-1-like [Amblyomma americanum]